MKRYLLLGCGYDRARRIDPLASDVDPARGRRNAIRQDFSDGELFTLDHNKACQPDIWADLEEMIGGRWKVESYAERVRRHVIRYDLHTDTLAANLFAEVHAYEVLEHLGRQGHVYTFFSSFEPIYHVLEPGGYLCGTVPSIHSPWAWGDPGHRRLLTAGSLRFLDRTLSIAPPSSDYRCYNHTDFELAWSFDDGEHLAFALKAIKPAREFVK